MSMSQDTTSHMTANKPRSATKSDGSRESTRIESKKKEHKIDNHI